MAIPKPPFVDGINPPPKISTPEEAPWKEIEALNVSIQLLIQRVDALAAALPGTLTPPVQVTPILPHKVGFKSGSWTLPASLAVQQLPSLEIPDGYPVTVVAMPGNTGNIILAYNSTYLSDTAYQFNGLQPGLAVSLKIKNLSAIWFSGTTAGDGLSWIVESDNP